MKNKKTGLSIRTKIISTILIIVAIIFAGFFYYNKTQMIKVVPLQEVGLQLNWVNQAEFAGNYVAAEKGFYKEQGLKVNIIPFDFNTSVFDSVLGGKADFGIVGSDELLSARARGLPVKAIAVIYKNNPAVMYSLKSSGISRPQDFIGKRVGLETGSNTVYLYATMMKNLNMDRSKINEISISFGPKEILDGNVDVATGYSTNEPNSIKEAGQDVNVIYMSDYGVNMYGDVIFTTDNLIKTNPGLVLKFLSASINGWQYAIQNEKESTDIIIKYATSSTIIHQNNMLDSSISLINDGLSPIGWMDLGHWEKGYNILLEQNILSNPINIKEAFDMQFLQNFYPAEKI